MSDVLYQHYRKEEREFIETVERWLVQAERQYSAVVTPFLTPREYLIMTQLVNRQEDLRLTAFGGHAEVERVRACIAPHYYQVEQTDFDCASYEIKFPVKFATITHGAILGSLLGSGIERNRIGDIITDGQRWQVILDRQIANYVTQQVDKIGQVGVRFEPIAFDALVTPQIEWEEKTIITPSLRLDTLLAKVYNFSRQRAKETILAGHVKVNYTEMERPDFELGDGDIVSVRRYGRFQILQQEGNTRKENIRLAVKVLVK